MEHFVLVPKSFFVNKLLHQRVNCIHYLFTDHFLKNFVEHVFTCLDYCHLLGTIQSKIMEELILAEYVYKYIWNHLVFKEICDERINNLDGGNMFNYFVTELFVSGQVSSDMSLNLDYLPHLKSWERYVLESFHAMCSHYSLHVS